MRFLVTGSSGQLAHEFITRFERDGIDCLAPAEALLDVTAPALVEKAVAEYRPDVVLNCAAYNNVDGAEADFATARAINADAVRILADACIKHSAKLVHYSTDYVFDGAKEGLYTEEDEPHPINKYGESKLLGERIALECSGCRVPGSGFPAKGRLEGGGPPPNNVDRGSWIVARETNSQEPRTKNDARTNASRESQVGGPSQTNKSEKTRTTHEEQHGNRSCSRHYLNPSALVLRTSWLYGPGEQNFLFKLRGWAEKNQVLKVVTDEVSVPTYTADLVEYTLRAVNAGLRGLYHLTNCGYASRYEWARAYLQLLGKDNLVLPVTGDLFETAARRPYFTAMSNRKLSEALGVEIPTWENALERFAHRE